MHAAVLLLATFVSQLGGSRSLEPFIVGGKPAAIEYFAHSAYMSLKSRHGIFVCGASVLNQHMLLTAAHCFTDLDGNSYVTVKAGSSNRLQGSMRYATSVVVHREYDPVKIRNDIALVYVKQPFIFGPNIKRVVLMKQPPASMSATVAGWGVTNEMGFVTDWLQQTDQQLWLWSDCKKVLKNLPVGTLCAGAQSASNYAGRGDSGSALIVDGYIQIGLVSFKWPSISRALVVYTDAAYHYDWIAENVWNLKNHHCSN